MQQICTYEIKRNYPLSVSEAYNLGYELNSRCLLLFQLLLKAEDKNGSNNVIERFVKYGVRELKLCEVRQNHHLNLENTLYCQTQYMDYLDYSTDVLKENEDILVVEEDIGRAFRRLISFYDFLLSKQDKVFSRLELNNAVQALCFGMNLRQDLSDLFNSLSNSYREGPVKQALIDLLQLNNYVSKSIKKETLSLIDQKENDTTTDYPIASNI